ncbi:hypothetical protein P2A57_24365 [Xanthomonas perforans]
MTDLPTINQLPRELLLDAHSIAAFERHTEGAAPVTAVEALDAHGVVLARTIIRGAGDREAAAEQALAGSGLERCGEYRVDPLRDRTRVVALVTLRVSNTISDFQARRIAADLS